MKLLVCPACGRTAEQDVTPEECPVHGLVEVDLGFLEHMKVMDLRPNDVLVVKLAKEELDPEVLVQVGNAIRAMFRHSRVAILQPGQELAVVRGSQIHLLDKLPLHGETH